jgi:hypothetical protein
MAITKLRFLALLAAAVAVTAACDPFPSKPSGPPTVSRAIASGSFIVDNEGPFPDVQNIVVDDATQDSIFYVWFNKPMDGSTIQAYSDTATLPTGVASACDLAASPLATKLVPAGSTICFSPSSPIDGGLIQVTPPDLLVVGSYKIGGTVKDYQGTPLSFLATFKVTLKPALTANDPYTVAVDWANDPAATGFTIQRTDTDPATTTPVWTDVVTGQAWGPPPAFRDTGLVPGSTFWYRIVPEGVTPATPSTPNTVTLKGPPSINATGNPLDSTGKPTAGVVQLVFSRIRTALYRVERAAPVTTGTPAWAPAGTLTTGTGVAVTNPAPQQGSTVVLRETGVPTGTWLYRVVPVFAGVDGTPTKTATAVVTQ